MTDNISTIVVEASQSVSCADWAAIAIALVAIIVSIIFSIRNIKLNKLVTLIKM